MLHTQKKRPFIFSSLKGSRVGHDIPLKLVLHILNTEIALKAYISTIWVTHNAILVSRNQNAGDNGCYKYRVLKRKFEPETVLLPFVVWSLLPTHYVYRGLKLHLITLYDTHTAFVMTPLEERSAHRRDKYLKTHNSHNRQTSMPPTGFEQAIPANKWPQTYAPRSQLRKMTKKGIRRRNLWSVRFMLLLG